MDEPLAPPQLLPPEPPVEVVVDTIVAQWERAGGHDCPECGHGKEFHGKGFHPILHEDRPPTMVDGCHWPECECQRTWGN